MDAGGSRQTRKKTKVNSAPKKINIRWVLTITAVSFFLSVLLSYFSSEALQSVGNVSAFLILFLFIALGILFDIIGISATAATEKQFHSMAAKRVPGARQAVWLTRNAEKVSSFCNDVVGDISGIISGATGAIIIANVTRGMDTAKAVLFSLTITGLIAAMTIGGKAMGKGIGLNNSEKILYACGRLIHLLTFRK